MSINLDQFLELANRWQLFHFRDPHEAMKKVKEETNEYFEELTYEGKLDEIGDVLVNAMRVFSSLLPAEQEAVYEIAKMKADRRLVDPGKKDKAAEYKLRDEIIEIKMNK